MTYYLSSQTTVAREKFSGEAWVKALNLAVFYGWQPLGTRLSSVIESYGFGIEEWEEWEEWDGTYLTNDGQSVIAEDALALAAALERALDDIPDFKIENQRPVETEKEDHRPEKLTPVERAVIEGGLKDHLSGLMEIHPFEYFAGDEKRHLAGFIKFCRLGSFTILRI
ncbi:MAG TPA: hypothetical protein VFY25_08905 [Anaerolineales bacterium]|nr:hypothetical protein [Anaerolineales bacterium]